MTDAARIEQLEAELQDAYLVIGQQYVAIRRLQAAIAQLQGAPAPGEPATVEPA